MSASNMIYGTAWKKERTVELVLQAVRKGFRAIDTACQPKHYREDLVGRALQILQKDDGIARENLFIQTKFTSIGGQDPSKPLPYNPDDSVTQQVRSSFQVSLANLHTSYLDSYILHSPLSTLERTLEAWRVLMSLQDEGKVRKIGVSNTYSVDVLEALGRERKVQVVQNRWYERNQWDREVFTYCRANGIQYQSFWTLSGSPSLLSHPAIVAFAQREQYTPEQVLFKLAQQGGITPLSGTTNELHMEQDFAAERITLADDDSLRPVKALLWG